MSIKYETHAGQHIRDAIAKAVEMTVQSGETVVFDFNGTEHEVLPTDSYETAKARASERSGHPVLEREEEMERFRVEQEERERQTAEAFEKSGAATEVEMREATVPTPKTVEDLAAYVASLTDQPHDYGTCVYAMSMAAVAAFNHVAHKLGVTGFQASCADMDILRRTRGLKHGFRVVNYGDLLYPQYWDAERSPIYEAVLADPDNARRFAEEAAHLLAEGDFANPEVVAHWKRLVGPVPVTVEVEHG